GHREAGLVLRAPEHVEVGERGLHHHDVGALVDVRGDLADRLVGVRRVHLVTGPVAEPWRALGGLTEGSVEGGRELRRVREDPDVECAPRFGDRTGYQMDPPNADEAIREIAADIDEGADIVMVKPALAYLDVLRRAKDETRFPMAAYNV